MRAAPAALERSWCEVVPVVSHKQRPSRLLREGRLAYSPALTSKVSTALTGVGTPHSAP